MTHVQTLMHRLTVIAVLAVAVACSRVDVHGPEDPAALFLTWQQDPATTMTIDWHTTPGDTFLPELAYRVEQTVEWTLAEGESFPFPHSDRTVHRVELTGLMPATTYEFQLTSDGPVYAFRTMPMAQSRPISFAVGGDVRHRQDWIEKTNTAAMEYDLDFIVWGGDLAYANGDPGNVDRWYEFFDAIKNTLIYDDGRVVPIVLAIGNHERRSAVTSDEDYVANDEWRERAAPFFYGLFAFPDHPGYAVLDFGEYLSLIVLDTDHTNPIEGAQTEWLADVLAERAGVENVFPVYHVPAYPSHRPYSGATSQKIRDLWVPLFEEYGVRVAFEHHDHMYKRTHPIRGGEISPDDGIVYLGDGAWGVRTRSGDSLDEWYIAEGAGVRHFILVTLDRTLEGPTCTFVAIDEDGNVIDEYVQKD